jgi:hypothetical protein
MNDDDFKRNLFSLPLQPVVGWCYWIQWDRDDLDEDRAENFEHVSVFGIKRDAQTNLEIISMHSDFAPEINLNHWNDKAGRGQIKTCTQHKHFNGLGHAIGH